MYHNGGVHEYLLIPFLKHPTLFYLSSEIKTSNSSKVKQFKINRVILKSTKCEKKSLLKIYIPFHGDTCEK